MSLAGAGTYGDDAYGRLVDPSYLHVADDGIQLGHSPDDPLDIRCWGDSDVLHITAPQVSHATTWPVRVSSLVDWLRSIGAVE